MTTIVNGPGPFNLTTVQAANVEAEIETTSKVDTQDIDVEEEESVEEDIEETPTIDELQVEGDEIGDDENATHIEIDEENNDEESNDEELIELPNEDNARAVKEIAINATNFPDAVFRNCILDISVDANKDKILSATEISKVKVLGIEGGSSLNRRGNIGDLKGIEHFTNLEVLVCYDNVLNSVDLSNNTKLKTLSISWNYIVNLDLSKNTELTSLTCNNNGMKNLDLSKNTKLTHLVCSGNLLSSLDVSKSTGLTWLECSENKISSLNLSTNTKLTSVICSYNNLTSLNVTGSPDLDYLECDNNNLQTLNTNNNPKLMALSCKSNAITSLNLSSNKQLVQLLCNNNALTVLEIPNDLKLEYLEFEGQSGMKIQSTAAKAAEDLAINVTWSAPSNATGYDLYRNNRKNNNWEKINTTEITGTSFKDTKVMVDGTYNYKIYAYQKSASSKKYLTDPRASVDCKPIIPIPQKVRTAVSTAASIKLSWAKINGVDGYTVYASTNKNGTYESIGSTDSNTIKHLSTKAGKTYYYKIRAYVEVDTPQGTIGPLVNEPKTAKIYGAYTGIATRKQIIPQVSGLKIARNSADSLKLTWSKIGNASGYEIYRSTTQNGKYKNIGAVKGSTTLTYTDKKLPYNTTYFYKVRAYRNVDKVKQNGKGSSIVSEKVYLDRTVLAVRTKSSTAVELNWTKIRGAQKYEIYRATAKEGTYKLIKTTTDLKYTNTGLAKNKRYYYKVKAVQVIGKKTYKSIFSVLRVALTAK